MGAFDQFKDTADDVAEQAKGAMNGKRNKPADAERPERERRMPQEGNGSESEDRPQRGMDRENEEQDDWA